MPILKGLSFMLKYTQTIYIKYLTIILLFPYTLSILFTFVW